MATKMQKIAERRAKYMANARSAARKAAQQQQHTLVALGSAYGLGWARAKKFDLPSFGGLSEPLLYGTGALMLSYFIKDKAFKRVSESLADGLLSVAAYQAGEKGFKSLFSVSGEDIESDYF
jgi:hypothetical protein